MSKSATEEYVRVMRNRYQAMRTKRAKGSVLDDFCQTSGYERKHVIKLLNGRRGQRSVRAGRKAVYGPDVKEVLKQLWVMSDQMCGKRFASYEMSKKTPPSEPNINIPGKLPFEEYASQANLGDLLKILVNKGILSVYDYELLVLRGVIIPLVINMTEDNCMETRDRLLKFLDEKNCT